MQLAYSVFIFATFFCLKTRLNYRLVETLAHLVDRLYTVKSPRVPLHKESVHRTRTESVIILLNPFDPCIVSYILLIQ